MFQVAYMSMQGTHHSEALPWNPDLCKICFRQGLLYTICISLYISIYIHIYLFICLFIYIYIYSVRVYVCINTYSITDMCCCQLAAAIARLLPVLNSSCLHFVAPKQGPDSGPKIGATIRKLTAQLPNLWPQFCAHGICVFLPSVKNAFSCDRLFFIHVFLRLVPGCWFHMQSTQWRKTKNMQAHSPKNGPAKGTFQKVQGCPCCSAASMRGWTLTATSNAKTCVQPAAVYRTLGATPGTPRHQSWLTSALCKAATPGKAARLVFVSGNVDSWGAGPCLRARIHIHHAEAALN